MMNDDGQMNGDNYYDDVYLCLLMLFIDDDYRCC